jgi:hypothetical protein
MKTLEAIVPFFPGFYNSELNFIIDQEIEQHLEYNELSYDDITDNLDYPQAKKEIAEAWLNRFNIETGFKLEFVAIDSPREYNFTTDRLVAKITLEDLQRARKIAEDNEADFEQYLRDTFTSYDGFYSSYSNDMNDWKDIPTDVLDCNEVMTYIAVACLVEKSERELLDDIHGHSSVYESAQHIFKS